MKRKRDKQAKEKAKVAQSEDEDDDDDGDWWTAGWHPEDQDHQDTQLDDDDYNDNDEEEGGWNVDDPSGGSGGPWDGDPLDEYATWDEEGQQHRASALAC